MAGKKKIKKEKEYQEEAPHVIPDFDDSLMGQTKDQQKMAFANSAHVAVVVQLLQECSTKKPLVEDTEYRTIVNAVTLDAQSNLILEFINQVNAIKGGSLFKSQ